MLSCSVISTFLEASRAADITRERTHTFAYPYVYFSCPEYAYKLIRVFYSVNVRIEQQRIRCSDS